MKLLQCPQRKSILSLSVLTVRKIFLISNLNLLSYELSSLILMVSQVKKVNRLYPSFQYIRSGIKSLLSAFFLLFKLLLWDKLKTSDHFFSYFSKFFIFFLSSSDKNRCNISDAIQMKYFFWNIAKYSFMPSRMFLHFFLRA